MDVLGAHRLHTGGGVRLSGPILFDAYVAREFSGPFALTVIGFSVILVSSLLFDLSNLVIVKHVAASRVLRMLGYKLPDMVQLALPVAVLFGGLLGFGRLQQDRELTVMRAGGLPLWRLALPVLAAGAIVSATVFGLGEWIVPASNHRYETLVRELVFEDPVPELEADVFFKGPDGQVFYIGQVDPRRRTLARVMIFEPQKDGFPRSISAQRGLYADQVWHLYDGVVRVLDDKGFVTLESHFDRLDYPMQPHFEQFFGDQKTTTEMSRRELGDQIRMFERSGLDVTSFKVDYDLKLAVPFASLLFAWLAVPLCASARRAGRMYGLLAGLGLVFGYYVLQSVARALGVNGLLSPWLAAWAANFIFLGVGAALFLRADRA